MTRDEAIEYLNISEWELDDCSKRCGFVICGQGTSHDYVERDLLLFRRYLNAKRELKEAKIELGNGKIINVRNKYDRKGMGIRK